MTTTSLTRRDFAALLLAGTTAAGLNVSTAAAQDYPSKVIKLIVPYGPGGPTDVVARVIAPIMQEALKQNVIIENRAGAGSVIGARAVASADPDGYTILLGNLSTYAIAPAIMKKPGYDPTTAFAPIVQTSDIGSVAVTPADFPAKTMQEFIAYAKANPGKVSFGSAGVGNSAHLIGELLKVKAGIDMTHVPYRSGAEMSNAIVAGQVQIGFTDLSASINLIREGKVKGLAITSLKRSPEFPDMPTMIEVGFPDVMLRNWTGAAAPAGTPKPIVDKLLAAINQALANSNVQKTLAAIGAEAKPGTSEAFKALIAEEFKRWGGVAKAANISID
ncbi:MAG: tripartite tricarboxylate transporter substrate binding protein [Rhizobiales bacterium]|nr:tripartite tricarboxylate transporter substrate binding protein [Hyphomicrobiales bacterium]